MRHHGLQLRDTGVAKEACPLQNMPVSHREVCTEKSLFSLKTFYPHGEKNK